MARTIYCISLESQNEEILKHELLWFIFSFHSLVQIIRKCLVDREVWEIGQISAPWIDIPIACSQEIVVSSREVSCFPELLEQFTYPFHFPTHSY